MVSKKIKLQDIYAIASLYYIKGVMDAQSVYNQPLLDEVLDSEGLCLILDGKKVELSIKQYIRYILYDMSYNGLVECRSQILAYGNIDMETELCYLLDFLYKKGCEQYEDHEGKDMKSIIKYTLMSRQSFLTPEGSLKQEVWHDLIRKYLIDLKVVYKKVETEMLDDYMVSQIRIKQETDEIEGLNKQTRNFILSGGGLRY
jgi:hypothetical protein